MLHMLAHTTRSAVAALVVAMLLPALLHAETSQAPDGLLPVEALSPGFLGMYRKVMGDRGRHLQVCRQVRR